MDERVEQYLTLHRKVTLHGQEFSQAGGISEMDADRWCISNGTPEQKYAAHKHMAKILYPDFVWMEDEKGMPWHAKWPDRTLKAATEEKHLIITGPASGAKTATSALYAVQSWISDPVNTMVLVGSTTRTDARKRIWASVCDKYCRWEDMFPGKLVDSHSIIKAKDGSPETNHLTECSSISLFAPENAADGAFNKLIGYKNKKVIVIADELTGMPASLIKALSNLKKNPWLQFIGIGNADKRTDVHGLQAEPEDGWASVTVDSDEWRNIHGGLTLHFDGLKTPNNYTTPKDKFPFLITTEQNEEDAKMGESSAHFFRMNRGMWTPGDTTETVVSEMEIVSNKATTKAVWQTTKEKIIGFDPSFTSGDRAVADISFIGMGAGGSVDILEHSRAVVLQEDATNKDVTADKQIAQKFVELLIKEEVEPRQVAIDATASGRTMASLVEEIWNKSGILRIDFAGKPTDRITNGKPARDAYYNYSSELWYSLKHFLRHQLIRGITPELMEELTGRRPFKGARALADRNTSLRVEPKADYKSRHGKSPDMADAFLMNLELARVRFGFKPDKTASGQSSKRLTPEEISLATNDVWDLPLSLGLDQGLETVW